MSGHPEEGVSPTKDLCISLAASEMAGGTGLPCSGAQLDRS
jgi:hypothetical protein